MPPVFFFISDNIDHLRCLSFRFLLTQLDRGGVRRVVGRFLLACLLAMSVFTLLAISVVLLSSRNPTTAGVKHVRVHLSGCVYTGRSWGWGEHEERGSRGSFRSAGGRPPSRLTSFVACQ